MKGSSESLFREALSSVDIEPRFIYKPPDDARNWKPCDYMGWFGTMFAPRGDDGPVYATAWFEVKETPATKAFPLADIRPSQWRGIASAKQLGFPYLIAIRWRRTGTWSLVDGVRLADWLHGHGRDPSPVPFEDVKSVPRTFLESRFGVSCDPAQLPSMIRAALTEGL